MTLREHIALSVLNIASTVYAEYRPDAVLRPFDSLIYGATAAQCCEVYRDDPRFERERQIVPELLEPRKMGATYRNMGMGYVFPHYRPLCEQDTRTRRWSLTPYGIECHGA